MTNENLYLIGTNHIDLDGPKRLEGLLRQISPDVVALEFHKDNEAMMEQIKSVDPEEEEKKIEELFTEAGLSVTPKQKKTMLEGTMAIRDVTGYEVTTSKAYTDANPNSRWEYIDISFFDKGIQEFRGGCTEAMKSTFAAKVQEPEFREQLLETLSKGKDNYLQKIRARIEMTYKNAIMMEELAKPLRDPETFEAMKEQMPPQAVEAMKQLFHPKRDEAMASRIRELYGDGNQIVAVITGMLHIPGLKSRILDLDPTTMTLADYVPS